MIKLILCLFVFSFSFNILAITKVGEVLCYEKQELMNLELSFNNSEVLPTYKSNRFCTYTIKSLSRVQVLIRKVNQVLFNGDTLTEPFGILQSFGSNDQVAIFSHIDEKILSQIIEIIPILDTKERFAPTEIIRINADIYEINETGLRNIGAEITSLRFGTGISDLPSSEMATLDSNGLGLSLKGGALELSGLISAERAKGNLKKVTSIKSETHNLSKFNYSDIIANYQAPGNGLNTFVEEEGLKISGTASINENNEKQVVLKDFDFYYGIRNIDGSIRKISLPQKRLVLSQGILHPLVSNEVSFTQTNRRGAINGLNRSWSKQSKRLLVYISAQILSWDEFTAELNIANPNASRSTFTKEEFNTLPDDCPTNLELLNGIVVRAVRGGDGKPQISYFLDPSLACKGNIKKRIDVYSYGSGVSKKKNRHNRSVEQLMLRPITIKGIKNLYFTKPTLKVYLKLRFYDQRKVKTKYTFVYANSTDFDISENIWIK